MQSQFFLGKEDALQITADTSVSNGLITIGIGFSKCLLQKSFGCLSWSLKKDGNLKVFYLHYGWFYSASSYLLHLWVRIPSDPKLFCFIVSQWLSLICNNKKFFNNFRTLWILLFDWYQIKLRNFYDPVGEKIRRNFANFIIKRLQQIKQIAVCIRSLKNRLQVKSHFYDKWEICMFES